MFDSTRSTAMSALTYSFAVGVGGIHLRNDGVIVDRRSDSPLSDIAPEALSGLLDGTILVTTPHRAESARENGKPMPKGWTLADAIIRDPRMKNIAANRAMLSEVFSVNR